MQSSIYEFVLVKEKDVILVYWFVFEIKDKRHYKQSNKPVISMQNRVKQEKNLF